MATPPELDPSQAARFELRRSTQSPEERLLYLERVAIGLGCHEARWGRGSAEALGRIAQAMSAEATSLATSRYEKALAAKVASRLDAARQTSRAEGPGTYVGTPPGTERFARDFILVPGDSRVIWSRDNPGVVGIATGTAAIAARNTATGAVHTAPPPPAPQARGITIRCRHGALSACDLNERNASGETALWAYVDGGKVDEVKALLNAGADPNVAKLPGGRTPIEVALGQVLANYDNAARAAEIVDALAADPRTTLHGPLKEDLASDPSSWQVHTPQARERVLQRREALARLPARHAAKPDCEDPGFDFSYPGRYDEPPPRLIMRR